MSRLFKKNNSVSKIVALWLVFIMLTTPFFAHAGLKNDSKAESATPGTPTATIYISATESEWETNMDLYYKSPYDATALSDKYYYGVNDVKVTSNTSNVKMPTVTKDGVDYTLKECMVRFIVSKNVSADPTIIDESKLITADNVALNDTNGWYLYAYIKPIMQGVSEGDIYEGTYALYGSYHFVENDPMADNDDPTNDSDDASPVNLVDPDNSSTAWVPGNWYNSVGIKNETGSNLGYWAANTHKCAGLIRYGYAEKGSTDITWSTEFTTGGFDVEPVGLQGECDIYVGLFATEDDATNNVPITKRKIETAKIDNVAPVIEKQGLFYSEDWENFDIDDATPITGTDNKVLYRDGDAEKYRYYVKVADDSGSPVTVSTEYGMSGLTPLTVSQESDNVWYAEDVKAVNETYSLVRFKLEDSFNETRGTLLPKIVPADTTLADFTFDWSYGAFVTGATSGSYKSNGSGSWYTRNVTDDYITLRISGKSYNEVEKIYITNGSDTVTSWVNNNQVTPDPYYNISNVMLTIPEDTDANANYEDLNIHIKYKNVGAETEVAMNDIFIDQTAPIFCANTTQPATTADIVDLADAYPADKWYKSSDYMYIYFYPGLSGVTESRVTESYYTINDGTKTNFNPAGGSQYVSFYTVNAGDNTIKLYAVDQAGNEVTEELTVKIDKENPEIKEATATTPAKKENSAIVFKATDDNGISGYKVVVRRNGTTVGTKEVTYDQASTTKEDTIYLKDIVNNLVDGQYYVDITVYDVAGNSDTEYSVYMYVDNSASTLISIRLQRSSDGSSWSYVSSDEVADNVYYMNNDGSYNDTVYNYRYEVSLYDEGGVDDATTGDNIDTTYFIFGDPATDISSNGYFHIYVDEEKVGNAGIPVVPSFKVVDLAGNEMSSPVTCDTKIAMVSANPTGTVTLKDADGNEVNYKSALVQAQLEAGTNKGYKAEITIKSHKPIDKIALAYDTDEIMEPDTGTFTEEPYSNVSKVYTYKATITIPTGSNKKFSDLKVVYQLEGDTTYETYDSLATILYDKTTPVITTNPENATPEAITYPTGWVQSFAVDYKITSGDGGVESLLAEASCTVDAVVNKVEDAAELTGIISLTTSSTSVDGTKITIKAKDKAGNELTEEHSVKVDADAPEVELEVAGEASYDLTTDAPLNEIPEVYYYAEDNLTFDVVTLKIEGPDSISKEIDLIAGIQNDEKVDINVVNTKTLDKFLDTVPDGEYTITLTAKDKAGNDDVATISFILDTEAPEVESDNVVFERKAPEGTWETVPSSEIKNGVYYMALDGGNDPYYDYRFKVTSTDDYKIHEWAVAYTNQFDACTFDGGTDAWDGNFYLNIDESKISTTSSKTISFNVWDWAGNYKSVTATPKLSGTSSDVVFDVKVYEDGEVVSLTTEKLAALKKGTDKTYQIYVDTYSVYEIESVYLADKDDAHVITDGVIDTEKSVFDPVSKQYRYVVTFDIPNDDNDLFEDLTVYTKDAKGTSSHKIATILYDDTNPLLLDTNGDTIDFPTEWVDEFVVDYKIISGEEAIESLLAEVSCTVDTATNSKTDVDKLTGTISITTSSATVDGTKVSIKAKDGAGHSLSETHYIKVDADAPEVELKVDGETSYDITADAPLKEIPEVFYSVEDNLTFDVVTLKIEGPDGISKEIDLIADIESDEKVDISVSDTKTLDKLLGSVPDGEYTLTLTAKDKAGNDDVATISFILDTEAPEVLDDTVVFERKTPNGDWETVPSSEVKDGVYYMALDEGSDPYYDYRFKVTSADTYKIDESTVSSENQFDICTFDGGTDAWDGNFYLNIDESKISSTAVKSIKFNLYDWAGNYTPVAVSPKLSGTSSNVVFESIVYEAGEAIELTPAKLEAIKKGTDKNYQVYVDTYSIYKIEEVYLADKDGVHKITQGVVDTEKSVFDPVSKQYRYVVTFDIPSEENAYFDELSIYTKDAKKTSSVELITILYDDTDPLVLDMDGEELTITTDWVDKIDVDYEITSGDGDVESLLGEAFCTIESAEESLLSAPSTNYQGNILIDESSKVVEGTTITIAAKDLAGNTVLKEYVVKVDADSPVVDEFTVAGNSSFAAPIKGDPVIDATISDNLTFKTAVITVVGPTGTFTKSLVTTGGVEEAGIKIDESYALSEILGDTPKDGDYEVTIDIEDKAGNTDTDTVVFRLDNTDPVVTADIASGTVSTKSDYYYNTAVGVDLSVTDINLAEVKVTDNDKEVSVDWSEADANGKSVANIVLSDEGAHQIKITAKDKAGTDALPKEVSFYIDETDPVIALVLNGGVVYDESMGMLDITRDVTLDVSVSDTNEDKNDLNYQLIQTKPDEATTTAQYIKTDIRSFTYTEEAEYTINLFSIDKADNQGNTRTVKFRIDNTAPALSITGVSAGGSSVNATTVTFTMQEAFWWDAHGTVNIYRQPGDGMAETLLKTIEITPTAKSTSVSETLAETGIYRFEFTASDRAGHTTETSQQFMVDRTAPLVTLTGASNYEITDKIVEIYGEITDDFYSTKKVEVVGTRTDINGKVHTIEFSYNQSANPTVISKDLTEDGIYDITITATDTAGNSDSKSLHFTIDKSEPVIGDLSKYDGTILTEFNWDEDLDELISDLTVCDVHMYLNGSEYDGTSKVEDGAYTLLIVAEDEMGNKVEKSVEFVLDTKAPVILVTGVEEDEVRMEDYNITVSLQLEEDTLTSVLLNGKSMTIGNNVCTFTVSEKGEYKLEVFAVDAAGNDVSYEMEFKYGEESVWWIWLLIALAALLVIFFIIIILKKKGQEEEKK